MVRLVGDRLMVFWPEPEDAAGIESAEFTETEHQRKERLKLQVRCAVLTGSDLEFIFVVVN